MNGYRRKKKLHQEGLNVYEEDLQTRLTACGLTPRQQQVVELVMRGLSNREIAAQLCIEEYTVKVHMRDIFYRLNVHRRTALIAKILQLTYPQ